MDDFESMQIQDRKIIVGIDFGTTYSGVAWAETMRPDLRTHINQWPIDQVNNTGKSSEKVPTILHYSKNKWFKLGLNLDSGKDLWHNPTDRTVDILITDYLSVLNKHVMFTFGEKLGASADVLRNYPIEFVLTVPAIWTESAKQRTLDACEKAGLTTEKPITLVSEPEAAAIYALHGLDPHGLQEGDTFVLCDAGGGIVDLISYTITSLRPILEVEEAAPGSGGMAGSTYLNRAFAAFLKKKLGLEKGWDEEILGEAVDRFERDIKPQFSINDPASQTYNVPVMEMADSPSLGIKRGRFALQNKELRAIFDPIINEIIQLVKDEILATKTKVKAVILVGGFGASAYLKDCLKAAIGSETEVKSPANSWLSVVHGAVMKGLANSSVGLTMVSITCRTARKHIGIELGVAYDHALHSSLEHKKYMDEKEGLYRVRAMEWFIKKGDKVSENEPYLRSFYVSKLVNTGRINSVSASILCDQTSSSAPLEKTGSVQKLVNLTANLSSIPTSALDRVAGKDGKTYYEVHCDIKSVYLSASTTYTLIHKGVRYDSVTAEYV